MVHIGDDPFVGWPTAAARIRFVIWALAVWLLPMQGLCQTATVAAGGEATGGAGSVSFSIGQVADAAIASQAGSLYPGVQQAYADLGVEVDEGPPSEGITVYPSATSDRVFVLFHDQPATTVRAQLYDARGSLVDGWSWSGTTASCSLAGLANGPYRLVLFTGTSFPHVFSILKVQ